MHQSTGNAPVPHFLRTTVREWKKRETMGNCGSPRGWVSLTGGNGSNRAEALVERVSPREFPEENRADPVVPEIRNEKQDQRELPGGRVSLNEVQEERLVQALASLNVVPDESLDVLVVPRTVNADPSLNELLEERVSLNVVPEENPSLREVPGENLDVLVVPKIRNADPSLNVVPGEEAQEERLARALASLNEPQEIRNDDPSQRVFLAQVPFPDLLWQK